MPAAVLLVLFVSGALSGFSAGDRIAATLAAKVPAGPIEFVGVVTEDDGPRQGLAECCHLVLEQAVVAAVRGETERRDLHGSFTAVEDLLDVGGIGEAKLAAMRDSIVAP